MAALSVACAANPVRMKDDVHGCVVRTDQYRLLVDVRDNPMVRVLGAKGERALARLGSVWLEEDGRRYETSDGEPRPHFHPLRSGPYLVEVHIENIILKAEDDEWPGLAELSLYCHEDRVFVVAAFIRPDGEWVNRGMYVYEAPESRRECPQLRPSAGGLELWVRRGKARVAGTAPVGEVALERAKGQVMISRSLRGADWEPGSAHEVGWVIAAPRAREWPSPLASDAFEMTMGEAHGYDPASGLYRITAQTSGTPEPPKSLRAGAHFTLRNDDRPRRILIDQRDPWGGISGGIMRDGSGLPLPIAIQFGLNFPEHHQDAGEPGWATLTYPLELGPNETREIRAEHLYHALSDRECTYLTSLDNIGDPLLLQTTVGRSESHTLTTGPYPGERKPGNELRVNDFRRIYSQIVKRSVSAILPTFFGYWDERNEYQGLMPGFVSFRETGPFLTEYTVEAATSDGAVSGDVRVWQAAHADMTRIFSEVSLRVEKTVRLSESRPAPLFFLRHHAFNPMAFRKYAYPTAEGFVRVGDLSFARTVVENGTPMGSRPFGCIYNAGNAIDDGIPCSDITGNAGFVVLAWDVRIGSVQVQPGAYAFCTGADDPDGAYARDVAIVPTEPIRELPAGSRIRYRAVQVVYGDNSSDYQPMEQERERWRHGPLRVRTSAGGLLSNDPPEITASDGRVEVEIEGGTDWIPVWVSGFDPALPLQVRQTDSTGSHLLGPGKPDEPWYSAWPAENGKCGFTFLVRTDPTGASVRLEVW